MIKPELSWQGSRYVKKVNCGGNHSVLLLDDGRLYGCGDNSQSQLGSNNTGEHWVGWQVMEENYRDVTCGWEFTAVINTRNQLLVRGRGLKGELGIGEAKRSMHFARIMDVQKGSKLFSSFQNCVVVEPYGEGSRVLGWGSNTKCQVKEPKCRIVDRPHVIYATSTALIDYVAMGKDFIVVVDTYGHILHVQGSIPQEFYLEDWRGKPVQISCMWSSLHVLYNQSIYSYGNGNHGQLYENSCLLEIDFFNTGSEHGILISKDSKVFCWGWGEHGNCGRTSGNGSINDYSNVISPLNEIFEADSYARLKIYGGYASTWIVCEC